MAQELTSTFFISLPHSLLIFKAKWYMGEEHAVLLQENYGPTYTMAWPLALVTLMMDAFLSVDISQ